MESLKKPEKKRFVLTIGDQNLIDEIREASSLFGFGKNVLPKFFNRDMRQRFCDEDCDVCSDCEKRDLHDHPVRDIIREVS